MKNILLQISIFLFFSISSFAQTGWYSVNSNTNNDLYKVYFINQNVGFAIGFNGTILKTYDSGETWMNIPSHTIKSLVGINFINENTGFIAGSNSPSDTCLILKTTNSGETWFNLYYTIILYDFKDVYFLNSNTGIVVGKRGFSDGLIFITHDAGIIWTVLQVANMPDHLNKICFIDNLRGFIAGSNGEVLYTSNAGSNWTIFQPTSADLYDIEFFNSATGWIVGYNELIMKTINSGNNWLLQHYNTNQLSIRGFEYVNDSNLYTAGDSGKILKSFNGGINWYQLNSTTTLNLYDIEFLDMNTGITVGISGKILKTTNGGGVPVGIEPIKNEVPTIFALSQNYPNPFNPATTIEFDIPKTALTKFIIYDAVGREIKTLINEELNAGKYKIYFDGSNLSSGIYYYRLSSGDFKETRKMVLLK